jgi:amino acid adenylation domain-containing protein
MLENKEYLHLLFETQVKLTPDNIAIIDIDHHSKISFNGLNKEANKLAKLLCQRGVTRGTCVAIMIDSSIYFSIAVLAVLKNNAIFIPIDTSYPVIKKIELIKDATATHLLLPPGVSDKEISKEIPLLKITWVNEDDLKSYSTENMDIENIPVSLSHISYTSGTSGKPKGVLVRHESMINHVRWRIKTYGYTSEDVTLQLVSNSMDGFSAIFFTTLLSGGKLVLLSNAKRKDFFFLNDIIQSENITNFCIVPSMLQGLLNYQVNFFSLRFIVLAGEKINPILIRQIKNKKQDIKLISEYGAAESTCTTSFNVNLNENNTTHIGQPIDNMEIFLLDDNLKEQTEGEICISGKGVSSGYHNNEKLTRNKFLNNSALGKKVIYRTGDFARKLPNGDIEYIGRIDRQVKIRGNRIELEEIENCILKYDGVSGAIVKAIKDHDSNVLCAYLVLNNKKAAIPALKKFITSRLPIQAIPSFFVVLDSFPLTTNGKINIDELPNPINKHCEATNKPKTECQEILRKFFSDALGKTDKSEIGITDNFFEMGGNSLNIAMLLSKIKKHYDKVIPLDKFKEISTIERMEAYLVAQMPGLVLN